MANNKKQNIFQKSLILNNLYKFSKFIYSNFLKSFFVYIITFYGSLEKKAKESFLVKLFSNNKTDVEDRKSPKRAIAHLFENSFILKQYNLFKVDLTNSRVLAIALLILPFSIVGIAVVLIKTLLLKNEFNQFDLYIYVSTLIIGIILAISKSTIGDTTNNSRILTYLFSSLTTYKLVNEDSEKENKSAIPYIVSAILGIIISVVSIFVNPLYIILSIFALLGLEIVMRYPEFGGLLLFLFLPFAPTLFLVGLVLIVDLSFFLKVIKGKRIFKLNFIDFLVIVFSLFVITGGFVSINQNISINNMLVYICFISSYFVVSKAINTVKLQKNAATILALVVFVVSLIGIYDFFLGTNFSSSWLDTSVFSNISNRASSTFENPNVLGEFLVLTIPVILALLIDKSNTARSRFASLLILIFCISCLVFTWSRGAWIGLIISIVLYCILYSSKNFGKLILLLPLGVIALFVSNSSIIDRLTNFSDSSTSYRLNIWEGTLKLLQNNFLSGYGIGEKVFSDAYVSNSLAGAEVAFHSHSLYLQLICELGIFALILFVVLLISHASMTVSFLKESRNNQAKLYVLAISSGISAFLIQGLAEHVFYNNRIFLFFWMMLGLLTAIIKTEQQEEQNQEQYFYICR